MGWLSNIWSKAKQTYSNVDSKLGGYLPGGQTPAQVSQPTQTTQNYTPISQTSSAQNYTPAAPQISAPTSGGSAQSAPTGPTISTPQNTISAAKGYLPNSITQSQIAQDVNKGFSNLYDTVSGLPGVSQIQDFFTPETEAGVAFDAATMGGGTIGKTAIKAGKEIAESAGQKFMSMVGDDYYDEILDTVTNANFAHEARAAAEKAANVARKNYQTFTESLKVWGSHGGRILTDQYMSGRITNTAMGKLGLNVGEELQGKFLDVVSKVPLNTKAQSKANKWFAGLAKHLRSPKVVGGILVSGSLGLGTASLGTAMMAMWGYGEEADFWDDIERDAREVGLPADMLAEIEAINMDFEELTRNEAMQNFIPYFGMKDEIDLKTRKNYFQRIIDAARQTQEDLLNSQTLLNPEYDTEQWWEQKEAKDAAAEQERRDYEQGIRDEDAAIFAEQREYEEMVRQYEEEYYAAQRAADEAATAQEQEYYTALAEEKRRLWEEQVAYYAQLEKDREDSAPSNLNFGGIV